MGKLQRKLQSGESWLRHPNNYHELVKSAMIFIHASATILIHARSGGELQEKDLLPLRTSHDNMCMCIQGTNVRQGALRILQC